MCESWCFTLMGLVIATRVTHTHIDKWLAIIACSWSTIGLEVRNRNIQWLSLQFQPAQENASEGVVPVLNWREAIFRHIKPQEQLKVERIRTSRDTKSHIKPTKATKKKQHIRYKLSKIWPKATSNLPKPAKKHNTFEASKERSAESLQCRQGQLQSIIAASSINHLKRVNKIWKIQIVKMGSQPAPSNYKQDDDKSNDCVFVLLVRENHKALRICCWVLN